jgi:hypothetical protein
MLNVQSITRAENIYSVNYFVAYAYPVDKNICRWNWSSNVVIEFKGTSGYFGIYRELN